MSKNRKTIWYAAGNRIYELDGDEVPVTAEDIALMHNELAATKKENDDQEQ